MTTGNDPRSRRHRQRLARRLPLLLPLCLALALAAGCEAPELPEWEVDLTVPVTHRVDTIADLIDGEENLGVDSLGTAAFSVTHEIERVAIEDELAVDPFSDSADYELGPIRIDTPEPRAQQFEFRDVWPQASLWDGELRQVAPFTFAVTDQLPAFGDFQNAEFERADCLVTIDNDLPVPLASAVLTFRNSDTKAMVGTAAFGDPVPPGASRTAAMDLAGAVVESQLEVEIAGSGGGGEEPVLVDASASFAVELAFAEPVTVARARTAVEPQLVVRSETIDLDGGGRPDEVEFLDGTLAVDITNTSELVSQVTLVLPEFVAPGGDTLRAVDVVPPGASRRLELAVAGHRFRPDDPGEARIELRMQVDSQGEQVEVDATDTAVAAVELAEPARVVRFRGVLDPTAVEIAPVATDIELPDGLDELAFAAAAIDLELWNAAGFPVDLDLALVGTGETGEQVTVPVRARLAAAAAGGEPARTVVHLDETNSNAVELMNLMPRSLELGGTATVGDGATAGSIARGDYLEGSAEMSAPFVVALGADRIAGDPEELDIDDDTRATIRDDVAAGTVSVEITSHLPAGGTAYLVVGRTADAVGDPDLATNLVLAGDLVRPSIGPDGLVAEPATAVLEFQLDKADLRFFEQAPTYTGIVFDLAESAGGDTVRFLGTDWVEVRAVAVLRTRMDFE